MNKEEALMILRRQAGRQFDPAIVDVFMMLCAKPAAEQEVLAGAA
jgi:response regulator RpfG family c-di-GMP phosphodiesterase